MPAMGSFIKLFNMWEIQLLVLLSFTLQTFLFFTGSLRQRSTSMFLRFCIWGAYLGADFVAVYTIGLVTKHDDTSVERHIPGETQALAFFWAPFLLIHLGGQDTITAFAMEDNNLWLRHLLNLVVQVILAIYVFWKSIGTHNLELLVSGIFVFVVGIIKYWERIWSLNCGSFNSLESDGQRYKVAELPVFHIEESIGDGYDDIVRRALCLMPRVYDIFSGRSLISRSAIRTPELDAEKMFKMVSIVLNVMYADLYTKALVVRTMRGIILRCISQMSAVVAFALFHANEKQRYSKVDITITYSLFVGGFFLELCAVCISMMSPWTWAWLKARKFDRLARLSWFIFSSDIGWRPEEKQLGRKSMGQYMLSSWVTSSGQARTWNQRVMTMVKWLADLVRVERKKIFWISKLLDTEYVDVDKKTMEFVEQEISALRDEFDYGGGREWPNTLVKVHLHLLDDFGITIVALHGLTEIHLSKYPHGTDVEANASDMMEVCRKLSNYMMYLLVTHPSMLPLNLCVDALVERIPNSTIFKDAVQEGAVLQPTKEVVQELVYMWARLLIYAAGKSRPEMHAAELSRGGELITFVWLILALHELGYSQNRRIRITNTDSQYIEEISLFPVPTANGREEARTEEAERTDEISHE